MPRRANYDSFESDTDAENEANRNAGWMKNPVWIIFYIGTILFRLLTELVNELLLDLVKFDLHSNVYPLPNDRSSFPRDEMGIGGLFNVLLNKLTDSGKTVKMKGEKDEVFKMSIGNST